MGGEGSVSMATDTITEASLARLSDAELRALVLERLTTAPETSMPGDTADMAVSAQEVVARLAQRLGEILGTYDELPGAFATAWTALTSGRDMGGVGMVALVYVVSLGVALLSERLGLGGRPFAVGTPLDGSLSHGSLSLRQKMAGLGAVILDHGIRLLVFAVTGTVVFLLLSGLLPAMEQANSLTFFFYLAAIVLVRFISAVLMAYYSPRDADRRIPSFSSAEAWGIGGTQLVAIGLGAFGYVTCALFSALGIHGDVHVLMLLTVGSVLFTGLAISFVVHRAAFTRDLRLATGPSSPRARIARAYPWIMGVGTLALWAGLAVAGLLGARPMVGAGLATVALLAVWPGLDAAVARDMARTRDAADPVARAILRVARISQAIAVLLLLALLWRVDLVGGPGSESIAAAMTRAGLDIGLVVLLAYAAWEALRISLDRKIAEENAALAATRGDTSEMEIGGAGLSRLGTLLPLFKRAGQVTILTIALMIVLSSLGVDIGPVLAGAGVVGLAIGFGSQTLVRDIVSGAFFLIDDAFRVGEYVDLGSVKGSVEKIGVRSLQLRHHKGALNTIPFGEIATIQNYSRDWAIMKLRMRVPFDTDVEKVRKLLKRVGQQLLEREDIKDDFLQPFKSQGVVEVDDYGLIISTKFMSKPGKQFLIRRHAYAAVQKAFAENGIEFSKPEVRVAIDRGTETATSQDEAAESLAASAGAVGKLLQKTPAQSA